MTFSLTCIGFDTRPHFQEYQLYQTYYTTFKLVSSVYHIFGCRLCSYQENCYFSMAYGIANLTYASQTFLKQKFNFGLFRSYYVLPYHPTVESDPE